jgi:hypothetical protein
MEQTSKIKLTFDGLFASATIYMLTRDNSDDVKYLMAKLIKDRMKSEFFSDGTVVGTVLYPYQFSCWGNTENRAFLINSFINGISQKVDVVLKCIKIWNEVSEVDYDENDCILGFYTKNSDEVCPTGKPNQVIVKEIDQFVFVR